MKSPMYGQLRALVGGVAGWFIGGDKAMEGQRVIQWNDTKACWRTKMRLLGKRSSSAAWRKGKLARARGKELV
ncbi:hypothetical protein [Bartonella sp. TT121SHDZB]|uniref:hypothetical protein n=1 Tax=Bartonella sp. TT121SHDZB TaxID=3243580 RepID=UPI0035CF0B9D